VEQTCPFIEREKEWPSIDAKPILLAITLPRIMPRRAGPRDGAELPELFAVARVIRARIADPADGARRCVGADDDCVLVDEGHWVVRQHLAASAVGPEAGGRRPGLRVDGHQPTPRREDDPRRAVALARPVRDAAPRGSGPHNDVTPDLAARVWLEGDDAI